MALVSHTFPIFTTKEVIFLRGAETGYLTLEDLARRWRVKPKWIYSNHRQLGIPSLYLGRQLRFPLRQVEDWEVMNSRNLPMVQ